MKTRENSQQSPIIDQIGLLVKNECLGEGTGHDWWHINRVHKMAVYIANEEGKPINMFILETAALLHDVGDWKFFENENVGAQKVHSILKGFNISKSTIASILDIIEHISFKGAHVPSEMGSMEGKIVQDADRLDAMGAIGIARTFAYGGSINQPLYDPDLEPHLHETFKEYKTGRSTTINHFYEKLLLLKDRMNTETARKIANRRHEFMEAYLEQFYKECAGEL